ncbi:Lrp/AsnC family transcriptional regulator [Candidatus Bathyarchaeota archaeon]|nr:MAG: Lrp/AsnC family transcriptional regulator [Candidatus Bathyarchaeota archaeon]
MDKIDKELLQLTQDEFPITKSPWAELGRRLKITEEEILMRLKRLCKKGVIRKIGPIINARKIGLKASTLVVMKVPEDRIEHVASIINEYECVSHNYQREHEYNLWFTIKASNEKELRKTIEEIKRKTEILDTDVLDLPALHIFKIDVRFQLTKLERKPHG